MEHSQHIPVMLEEVLQYLQPRSGGLYIDGTLGGGGHTAAILERSTPEGRVLGIDTDEQALQAVLSLSICLAPNDRVTSERQGECTPLEDGESFQELP